MERTIIHRLPRAIRAIATVSVLSATPALAAAEPPTVPTTEMKGPVAEGALARGSVPARIAPSAASPGVDSAGLALAVGAGLLAALGLAGTGMIALSWRRRERRFEAERHKPVSKGPPTALDHGAVFADPEERRAAIELMVAAPPDAGNPFVTRAARMRRARGLLQARERLREQNQRFDRRVYRSA
ncbi:hypothetical protein [Novosphingobium sp.]|uniref:hypothetical protein n=1 Tax=Novosphingobium sp. TaxID=1874826 RepID=UPI002B4937A0|nr:hypothetical protein [Novosphingobium sp.]HKR93237.1 hypothetical protein [Novosphingobium sp.]